MKVLILLATLFSLSVANEIFDVSSLDIQNFEFELDENFVNDFLDKYELGDEGEITAIVNEYADKIFKNIEDFAIKNNLDPLNLTDIEADFLGSSINLTNGQLFGIATINRSDDVSVSYTSNKKVLEIRVPIIFSDLNFFFDYHVIILLIGPKGNFTGDIQEFTMDITLQFDFNTYHAAISHVKTTNKGHIKLAFHGNSVVDAVVNVLTEFVTTVLQPVIGLLIEGVVTDVADLVVNTINDAIDSILYPDATTTIDSFF